MILSHAYKYVFLGTRKTGSTSSEVFLLQNLFEKGDISSRDFRPEHEHPEITKPCSAHVLPGTTAHWDTKYLVERSGINLAEYKVFAVLRDPYERMVSRVFYKDKGNAQNIFEARQILSKGYVDEDDRDWPQSAYFKYNNKVIADVWDYRLIAELLPAFVLSYGKEPIYTLKKLKSTDRPVWATTKTVITPAIKQKISEVFAEDIELYNTYCSSDIIT